MERLREAPEERREFTLICVTCDTVVYKGGEVHEALELELEHLAIPQNASHHIVTS